MRDRRFDILCSILFIALTNDFCMKPVSGKVAVVVPGGKKVEHLGIKIEMIGLIGNAYVDYSMFYKEDLTGLY